ncbi:MAG: GAF and ANTAR domain-containing protein [Actinomycetia bacterium]|nr:GAF and ANTAR domain-containing protein [Actinomycetes bacterium]
MTDEAMSEERSEREPAGASLMKQLGGVVKDAEELQTYLNTVVHALQREVDACDEVGITLLVDSVPHTAAYTTALTLEVDGIQYSVGDGPCLDAYRNMRINCASFDEAAERWPTFAKAAGERGFCSLLAVPLASEQQPLGALNLYAKADGAFDDVDVAMVQMAAQRCADTIAAAQEIIGARTLASQLEQAMASRAVIEQSKGILMGLRGISEHEAFELIRKESQDRNIKVRDLAERIVSGSASGVTAEGTNR